MEGNFYGERPTNSSISLADLSTLLGGHIAVCSSPELSIDEKTNFMKVIEQLPRHMTSANSHRVTSLVDFAGSTSGQLCSNKICGVDEFNKAITHANDFDRDLTATKEYKEYRNFHAEDFEAKAKDTGKNIEELAKKGFAIKNSQWNSYWRGKVAGGLCMALTLTAGKSICDFTLRELSIGKLQKDSSDLHAVIAVMIDGGPVTQQEQREMPQICDDVVFDLRRQGYDWASNAHVLLVRFPDVQTMLRSLDGEKNLCRSQRFEMKQKDKLYHNGQENQHNLCWEFAHFSRSAGASLFEKIMGKSSEI